MKLLAIFLVMLLLNVNSFSQIKKELKPDCPGPTDPLVFLNPISQVICPGTHVSFIASAGMVEGRQWEMSTDNGVTWYPSIGSSYFSNYDDTLTIPVVYEEMNGYQFRCSYYGNCRGKAKTTVAILSVSFNTVQIISQPANTAVCINNTADFLIQLSGSSLSYQWQVSTNGGISFLDMAGKNLPALHLDSVKLAMNNNKYHCIVQSECGATVTSNAAILTVNNGASIITSQPQNVFICESDTAYFTTTASGSNIQYQWQRRQYSTDIYSDIPGANINTLSIPHLDEISYYRCKITSNCNAVFTNEVYGYYRHNPSFYPTQVKNACAGDMAYILAVSNNTSQNYQWMVSSDSGVSYSNIPGEVSDRIAVPASASNNGYKYKCYVSSPCFTGYSNITTLYSTIVPLKIVLQSQNKNTCVGVQTNLFVEASGVIENYHWQISTDNGVTFTNLNSGDGIHYNVYFQNIIILPVTPGNFKYRCQVIGSCAPDIYSNPVTLSVFSNPSITSDTSLYMPCDTCIINIVQAFDTTGITIITSSAANPRAAGLGRYSLKVYNAANCNASAYINVGVKKLDTLNICSGSSGIFTSSILGSSYQWQINRGYGYGFEDVSDEIPGLSYDQISGVTNSTLKVGHMYSPLVIRCRVDNNIYSDTSFINIAAYWTGSVSNAWENPLNWSCGFVPNSVSDIHIFSNTAIYPVISSNNLQCRKLVIDEGATLKIKSGMNFYVHEYFVF